eukprot:SAG11_NODE_9308_length_923_cov_2.396845_1_plen_79_part_10
MQRAPLGQPPLNALPPNLSLPPKLSPPPNALPPKLNLPPLHSQIGYTLESLKILWTKRYKTCRGPGVWTVSKYDRKELH